MPTPDIRHCQPEDLDMLFEFYDMAIAYQKTVSSNHWQGFSREAAAAEIAEQRQYKLLVDDEVACVFVVSFRDPAIWGDQDHDALYLHRIVTRPGFRGFSFVKTIVAWAQHYGAAHGLRYIRMDTWADNDKLRQYYTGCGFAHVGTVALTNVNGLPKHYEGIRLNLFELAVEDQPAE